MKRTRRCPYCHDVLRPPETEWALATCRGCATSLHVECWDENGGCTTLGCARHSTPAEQTRQPIDHFHGWLRSIGQWLTTSSPGHDILVLAVPVAILTLLCTAERPGVFIVASLVASLIYFFIWCLRIED